MLFRCEQEADEKKAKELEAVSGAPAGSVLLNRRDGKDGTDTIMTGTAHLSAFLPSPFSSQGELVLLTPLIEEPSKALLLLLVVTSNDSISESSLVTLWDKGY